MRLRYLLARSSLALVLVIVLSSTYHTEAKVFTRCQLTRHLIRNNFSRTFLSNWVCLIQKESKKNTSAYTEKRRKKYYGLFQIPGEWCKEGRKGGKCDVTCESLLDEDISNDCVCAQKIFNSEGFKYWSKWTARCKGHPLPDIEKCPDFTYPPHTRRRRRRRIRMEEEDSDEDWIKSLGA